MSGHAQEKKNFFNPEDALSPVGVAEETLSTVRATLAS